MQTFLSQISSLLFGAASDPLLSNVLPQQNGIVGSNINPYLKPLPDGYHALSAVLVRDNLAVIPGDWSNGDIKSAFYDIQTEDVDFVEALGQIRTADFIGWDEAFFDIIGPDAVVERILAFPGVHHVHEAPVYVPESEELLFADTSVVGSLWAINVNTYQTRNITTHPPLHNVNGGTYHNGTAYFLTNGGPSPSVHTVNPKDGTSQPIVNNYRGRHLNSPNDIIVDSRSNLWFTDPMYGWYQAWPGIQPPELPNSIYFFNHTSKALIMVSNAVVLIPNGLAFSADESILYVSDSNSTSGRPMENSPTSLRNIWAFDASVDTASLRNPRLVYQTETGWPDGLRVTSSGLLIIAVIGGVDIIQPDTGVLLGKVNTPDDIIFNIEPIPGTAIWLLTGQNYIYKVHLREQSLRRWM